MPAMESLARELEQIVVVTVAFPNMEIVDMLQNKGRRCSECFHQHTKYMSCPCMPLGVAMNTEYLGMHACMCVYMCVCMRMCVCVCVCVLGYTVVCYKH